MDISSRSPPLLLMTLAMRAVACWWETPRRSAAGPTLLRMPRGITTGVPADFGVEQRRLGWKSSSGWESWEEEDDRGEVRLGVGVEVGAGVGAEDFSFLASFFRTASRVV